MAKVYGDEPGIFDEYKKLKGQPFKVRLEYLWTYFGKIAIAIVLGIIVIVSTTVSIIKNSKPDVISGICCSTTFDEETVPENLRQYLITALDLEDKKYDIDYTSSIYNSSDASTYYAYITKVTARIAAKDLDFIVSGKTTFNDYQSSDEKDGCALYDLSEYLPEDLYNKLEEEGRIEVYEGDFGSYPCLVRLDGSKAYDLLGLDVTDQYIGIICNTTNDDAVFALLKAAAEEN